MSTRARAARFGRSRPEGVQKPPIQLLTWRKSEFARPSRYPALFKLEYVPSAFIADGLARIQVRYPEIPVVFADSRKFAEEWTYRFLAAALADSMG